MEQRTNSRLVGTVKGPGENPHEYIFITSDNEHTRIGEFVYYTARSGQQQREILGSITERRLVRHLPDGFLSNPEIAPATISNLIGCELIQPELYEIVVTVKGYFEPKMGSFVNPRISPDPGQRVYLVASDVLTNTLSPRQQATIGSAHIGDLLTREPGDVPVVLDVKEVVSTHLSILAGTGSGKSYTASVLIEELMRPYNRAAVLVFDPHSEYDTLQHIQENETFKDGAYSPEIKIFQPDRMKVRFSSLQLSEIKALLPALTEKMSHFLNRAYSNVLANAREDYLWSLNDLKLELEKVKFEKGDVNQADMTTVDALLWRLNSKFHQSSIFSEREHIPLRDLVKPGQCTVFQMSDIDVDEQRVIVATILRRIYNARLDTQKGRISDPGDEKFLDYPVFVILEEGHRFAPQGERVVTTPLLKTVLSEGRKFGVGVCVISQRPGKLDQDVLSQCMTQFIMRIVNPIDQSSIASGVESAGRDMLAELPALTKGQAVIAGSAINTPVLCQVRRRLTPHGGETLDAPKEWQKYFSEGRQRRQRQEESVMAPAEDREFDSGFQID